MISRNDAEYVQIIHTNAGKYGTTKSHGHADFYPNAGRKQHGCELEYLDDVCSHRRAWVYYQESVNTRKPFLAVKCYSYKDFIQGNCESNTITQMGFSDEKVEGDFYLLTHSNPHLLSLGEDGIHFKNFDLITDGGVSRKPLLMSRSNISQKWDKSFEFDELLIVTENGEFKKKFVDFRSPFDKPFEDIVKELENVESSSGSRHFIGQLLLIFSILKIAFKILT